MTAANDDGAASRFGELRALVEDECTEDQAGKAIRELVTIADGGAALDLAVRFQQTAKYPSELLRRLWKSAADPDAFCAALLAPAFSAEGRSELRLWGVTSLTGLRHLVMLRTLHVDRCARITDLTEIGGLSALTDLDLSGCSRLEDLTPLSRLTQLTRLNLHGCRAVADTAPLLALGRLHRLDLGRTAVRSVGGFAQAFPALESLTLRGCRSFKEPRGLSGLERLTSLDLGGTGVRDLIGLRDVPAVSRLDLGGCARLGSLSGIDAMPNLAELVIEDCPRLKAVDGFGSHPRLTRLVIKGCAALADLSAVSSLTNLTHLRLDELDLLRDLAPVPSLRDLRIGQCNGLTSLGGLGRQRRLTTLIVTGCTGLRSCGDLSGLTALRELKIGFCPALTDLNHLGSLPALNRVEVMYCAELTDITGLAGSPVQRVSLMEVPKLASLRALDSCPGLRDLEVADCPHVQDFPTVRLDSLRLGRLDWVDLEDLASQHELRVLEFSGMGELKDISLLSRMPALEEVDLSTTPVEDCRPLLDLPRLKKAAMPRNVPWPSRELFAAVKTELAARGGIRPPLMRIKQYPGSPVHHARRLPTPRRSGKPCSQTGHADGARHIPGVHLEASVPTVPGLELSYPYRETSQGGQHPFLNLEILVRGLIVV